MKRFFLHLTVSIAVAALLAGALAGWRWWRTPAPVVRRLAPPGEFYLVQYVSWRTLNGVIGFPPGTRVKLREDRGETWLVNDGRYDAEMRPAQLTNALDVAEWALRADEAAQSALADYQQREREAWQRAHLADASRQAAGANAADAALRGRGVGGQDTRLHERSSAVAGGRTVAGAAWVYPTLTVVQQRTEGAATDLRLRVPTPAPARATASTSLATPGATPSRTPAASSGIAPRSTPTPPPANP